MNNNGALLKTNTTLFQIPFPPTLHSRRCLLSSIQLPKHQKLLSFHVVKLPSSSKPPPTGTEAIEEEEEDGDEDEDVIVPLSNMRQWSRNKPRGFGEGRVYDTSLEDKLLEELEQTRLPANLNNDDTITKHKEAEITGIRVRLVNLPKKKNIHRDLQTAFKPFTGIINILPAVSGNEKTREPVCKGFAFVDFKSYKEANRFVDTFSTQPITFGKVQKQIRCEIMKSNPAPASVTSSVHRIERSPLPVLNATMAINSNPVTETPLDPCVEDAAFDTMKIGDDDLVSATEDYDSFEKLNSVEAQVGSESLKKQVVVREKGKQQQQQQQKKKKKTTPKLSIPGSAANRLKMKEKALLSGVFSKYGGKSSD